MILLFFCGVISSVMSLEENELQGLDPLGGQISMVTEEDLLNYGDFPWLDPTGSTTSVDWSTSVSFFSKFYYTGLSSTTGGGLLTKPVKFDLTGHEPSWVLFGGRPISFQEFSSISTLTGSNQFWIQSEVGWSQYVLCPQGTGLRLLAYSPAGGMADIYEIYMDNVTHSQYNLYPGYNHMDHWADEVGRKMLFFLVNNQPSNLVILDVTPPQVIMPPSSQVSPSPPIVITTPSVPIPSPFIPVGDTTVILRSTDMRGFDVFVDDVYVGTDGQAGDPRDGSFTLRVVGNQEHFVKVWDGVFFYGKSRYYPRGVTTTLWVEPGYVLYV